MADDRDAAETNGGDGDGLAPIRAGGHASLAEALSRLPGPDGERFATLFERGSLTVEIYAPRGRDPQQPHTRDEIYVVVQGGGEFLSGERRVKIGPGDFLFVPAGVAHRFENFTDDLAAWVIFYGPEGGERAEPRRVPQVR